MKGKAIERINSLLLKRAVNIIQDESIGVMEKKELLKELRTEKQNLTKAL